MTLLNMTAGSCTAIEMHESSVYVLLDGLRHRVCFRKASLGALKSLIQLYMGFAWVSRGPQHVPIYWYQQIDPGHVTLMEENVSH